MPLPLKSTIMHQPFVHVNRIQGALFSIVKFLRVKRVKIRYSEADSYVGLGTFIPFCKIFQNVSRTVLNFKHVDGETL